MNLNGKPLTAKRIILLIVGLSMVGGIWAYGHELGLGRWGGGLGVGIGAMVFFQGLGMGIQNRPPH